MWLGLPVVTLGARFEPRGVRLGVAYTIALLLLVTVGLDAGFVFEHPEELIFPFALIVAMAILGGAAVQSEREHRRVAVIDPLTGLLNRSAFAQRLLELQHQLDQGAASSLGFLIGRHRPLQADQRRARPPGRATPSCATSPTPCAASCAPST